ncbi:U4/U6 x U5 tri-snRNP complex subunit Prp1 [Coemansia guatemalensis]|uniref:U4/U6 x U5 tri-snRNP complex subunit Prp1 n=1 Tax=Coemansia guatemalensis TaxID=2761395 RepID=A0A9W8LWW5_9FUNG|nr:U4/U6 x U5 tri-snRNP complex subunit Prp1 [Coemansia guatemalensis]
MYPVTKDFLGKPAPPGYVAGLGRGATGFTTRSDIGPAREAANKAAEKQQQAAAEKKGKRSDSEQQQEDDAAGRFANAENEEGLFSNMPYEQDDEEADKIWAMIDAKMEQRRPKRKQGQPDDAEGEDRAAIDQQLSGLKRQLQGMSEDEWNSIPDVSQLAESAARAKRRRKSAIGRRGERYSQVSDSSLMAGLGLSGYDQEIGTSDGSHEQESKEGTVTNFMALGQARDDVLRMKLDQLGDSASGKTTVDPRGYLTSLNTVAVQNAAEIGDISRARTLLKSVTQTNPKRAPGWIAAARLEEVAKKMPRARAIIAQGCENCPQSEDVWLEAARLNQRETARVVLASAVRNLPKSVKIWMCAAEIEAKAGDTQAQRRILRRALEFVPTSVQLWKAAVALEPPDDARVLLSHAVELVPLSVDLWLALARLESYTKAQKVLNRARRAVPTSHEIWIAAARLEEQQADGEITEELETKVFRIMAKAVSSLAKGGAPMDRDSWFDQALQCECDGYPSTCRAIVRAAANMGFDSDDSAADRSDVWVSEAERFIPKHSGSRNDSQKEQANGIVTARAIYALALDAQPADVDLWRSAADLEREHGSPADLEELLRRAVQYCPRAEVLWLIAAKEKWKQQNDIAGARVILEEAFAANPSSEAIILAAVKLESESGQYARALMLLERARETDFSATATDEGNGATNGGSKKPLGTGRVWMKSAVLLRQVNKLQDALQVARQGVELFPKFYKLWLVQAQLEQQPGGEQAISTARQTLSRALKQCPREPVLWISAARLEYRGTITAIDTTGYTVKNLSRARAILERARVYIPREPALWLESVELEAEQSTEVARALLARALQDCPKSGMLWAQAILLEPRPLRKAKSVDALKNADGQDPAVIVAVARLFWSERRVDKARTWFERATVAQPDYGDAWAWWWRFESEQRDLKKLSNGSDAATNENSNDVMNVQIRNLEAACTRANPTHGQYWPRIAKDPANARLSVSDTLHKVAEFLGSTRQL